MSGFGTLVQKDQPFVNYCQAFDCSKVVMNVELETASAYFLIPGYIDTITLAAEFNGVTIAATDITTDIISVLSGTFTITAWSDQVVGLGTAFTTELTEGDYLSIGSYLVRVYSIESDTQLTLTSVSFTSGAGLTGYKLNLTYDITPSFFGWTISYMPEGSYTFTLTTTFKATWYSGSAIVDEQTVQVYCEKYCCVYSKLADLADSCNDCMDHENIKKIVNSLFMWGLLEAYKGSAGCGDSVSLSALQDRLDKYCDYQPCSNC